MRLIIKRRSFFTGYLLIERGLQSLPLPPTQPSRTIASVVCLNMSYLAAFRIMRPVATHSRFCDGRHTPSALYSDLVLIWTGSNLRHTTLYTVDLSYLGLLCISGSGLVYYTWHAFKDVTRGLVLERVTLPTSRCAFTFHSRNYLSANGRDHHSHLHSAAFAIVRVTATALLLASQ